MKIFLIIILTLISFNVMAYEGQPGHFWFSQTQYEFWKRTTLSNDMWVVLPYPILKDPNHCVIDGGLRIYTAWTDSKEDPSKHDDMIYMGYGKYTSRLNGI